jgi:hypothetical protein
MSATGAGAVSKSLRRQQREEAGKLTWRTRLRDRFVVVDAEISPDACRVLEAVAWSAEPVKGLSKFMSERSKIESRWVRNRLIMVVLLFICFGIELTFGVMWVTTGYVSDIFFHFGPWAFLLYLSVSVLFLLHEFSGRVYPMVKARCIGHLLRAISACIQLDKSIGDMNIAGNVARNIEDASAWFDHISNRMPGHHAKMYSTELKSHARSGAQAIASTTSLLFAGSEGLADLRDRLARAILRIEADDWIRVEQLGVGEDIGNRKRLFRRLLEPLTIPLVVAVLTLLAALITLAGKMLEQ